jgi:mannose-6-phosphate isomerase-like protein (cupin superfamily)
MQIQRLDDARRFAPDKMVKAGLFATPRLYYDLYCLSPGQAQKVHSHSGSDKVYLVLEGSAMVTVGDEDRALHANECVLAQAGASHGVRNDTQENVVLLVVTTPPPL